MRVAVLACLMLAGCAGTEAARVPPPSTEASRAEDERLDRACLLAALQFARRDELISVKVVRYPDEVRQGFRPARRGIELRVKAGANVSTTGFPCQETEAGEAMMTDIGLGGL